LVAMGSERAGASARMGARVAVGAGCALLAACLAGTPLLISASASGAVQLQVEQACPTDLALRLSLFGSDENTQYLDAHLADLKNVGEPRVTKLVQGVSLDGFADGIARPAVLLNTEGQDVNVDPALPVLKPNEVAVSRQRLDSLGLDVGDTLTASAQQFERDENGNVVPGEATSDVPITIAAVFDDLPYQPAPSFWCGLSGFYEPGKNGDPPRAALMLASPELIDQFSWYGEWDVRLSDAPFTRREAEATQASFTRLTQVYADHLQVDPQTFNPTGEPQPVTTAINRAESLAGAVSKSVAPVRIVGVLTAMLVLIAAAVMLARERRRELRLLALRGQSPWRGGVRLVRLVGLPVIVGSLAGFGLALVGIRMLGPTPELERDRVVAAAVAALIGGVIATVAAAGVTTFVGDRFVDAKARRRWWRWVPFELPVIAAALLSARSLSSSGGMKMFGVEARGGQLLAQAFPQLAIATGVVVLARPTLLLLRRLRVVGTRLPRGLRLGVRRIVMEAAVTTTMLTAVALASGSFVLAGILSASADQQLTDKASLYIGSDLAINVIGPADVPSSVADRATAVQRITITLNGDPVDVLGIDLDTFERAVIWRADAASRPLSKLLQEIRWTDDGSSIPALFVGDSPPAVGTTLVVEAGANRQEISLSSVDIAKFFPGYKQGTTLAVVDRSALVAAHLAVANSIWVRDPPSDASALVLREGGRIRSTQRAQDVFDVVSYSAQRWAYTALGAFGILVACTVITLQLLVVEARRDTRRLAHLMMSRMGFKTRSLWIASVVEVGAPLLVGAAVGAGLARLAAGWSVRRLDPLPRLRPSSVVVTPIPSLVTAGAAAVVTALVLALVTVWSTRRGDPMEVSRGTA
jgi:hypothetical protein